MEVHFFSEKEQISEVSVLDRIGVRGREIMQLAALNLPILPGIIFDAENVLLLQKEKYLNIVREKLAKVEQIVDKKYGAQEATMFCKIVISPNLVIAPYPVLHNFGLTNHNISKVISLVNEEFAYREILVLVIGLLKVEKRIAELQGHKVDEDKITIVIDSITKTLDKSFSLVNTKKVINNSLCFLPDYFMDDAYKQIEYGLSRVSKMLSLEEQEEFDTGLVIQPVLHIGYGPNIMEGVFSTRDPLTGTKKLQGSFEKSKTKNAGVISVDINKIGPVYLKQLQDIGKKLEDHYREIRSIRFAIEENRLWLIDQRGVRSKSTQARVRTLLDLRDRKIVDDAYVVKSIKPSQLSEMLHPVVDIESVENVKTIAGGIAGAPGAAIGRVFFTTKGLIEEYNLSRQRSEDTRLILCMSATYADDVKAIELADGVISSEGGYAAHASVIARQYGKVSLVRPDMRITGNRVKLGNVSVNEGDYLTLSVAFLDEPKIYLGEVNLIEADPKKSGLLPFLDTVDKFMEDFQVRANADTVPSASLASLFGAGGIGLCRTEHMFFSKDRIQAVRQLIMSVSIEERKNVLSKLLPMQRNDMYNLFKVMKGKPVTIRLMDAPLHEFLPHNTEDMKLFLEYLNKGKTQKISKKEVQLRTDSLHEFNPMLGHRGCRLAVSYPEIYHMQMRAIFEAAYKLRKEQIPVNPEIMIPLIMNESELKLLMYGKRIEGSSILGLIDIEKDVRKKLKTRPIRYKIGTMIELPVAALSAGEIARYAQFFSFGTNDLTQTALGISRDDYNSFMPDYTLYDILEGNPFQILNHYVKELMAVAVSRGKLTRPNLKTGLCGEHGAMPENIRFCMENGLDYVSCSTYSVPIAKLAVAQINLGL